MSRQTIQTCPEYKHEGEMPTRHMVICDQCGEQVDMSTLPGTWTGGSHFVDPGAKSKVMHTDFCSWQCARAFERYHERAVRFA